MKKAGLFLLLFPPIWVLLSNVIWHFAGSQVVDLWWGLSAPWDTLFYSAVSMTFASASNVMLFWPVLAALGGAMLLIKK